VSLPPSVVAPQALRRQIDRLAGLPLRAETARLVLDATNSLFYPIDLSQHAERLALDPGWALAESVGRGLAEPLRWVAERPWWRAGRGEEAEALGRLWRRSVAVACAARRLARERGEADAARINRAGLLHSLGWWAVGAVEPSLLVALMAEPDPARRRALERSRLGTDAATLGRSLAERWGCDRLVSEVAWLHADGAGDLNGCVSEPERVALLQRAYAWAERTPWGGARDADQPWARDPATRWLVAEVQAHCGPEFLDPSASLGEERFARATARLRLELERSQAEAARRDLQLDQAVEALRRRLEQAEPALRAARLEALAEFAAGAGHELNNPLAVIQGRAQLLLAGQEDPETIRSLQAIVAQAQRAHRILRDLMYFARPPRPRPRPCQPDEILKACLRDLHGEAEGRGIRLTAEIQEPAPWAWSDPDGLRHLAEVFLRNALEATPEGGTVLARSRVDPNRLRWAFHDSGPGLSPTEARHLFDPFFCGRQAGRGLGLGLPRAARFVTLAGGVLDWHAEPGRGTTFLVVLPLEEPSRADRDEPAVG
jgi:signal transduction histidine kinase